MKKIGRGTSYRKALKINLIKNLLVHKKIQTTRTRGLQLATNIKRDHKKTVVVKPKARRRGDNAPIVEVEIVEPKAKKKKAEK